MIQDKSEQTNITTADLCNALEIPRSSFYRLNKPVENKPASKKRSHRKLSLEEENHILGVLSSERFVDMAASEIFYTLLDEGIYLCSQRSIYRILERNKLNVQRRQRDKGNYQKPELLAEKPNELWSWDITKLKGPAKWTYFYLYVILDVFSRAVVGWMVSYRESAELAEELIKTTCQRQNILPEQLTIHSDRGAPMKSKAVAFLLADLGITKTHSRPYVSNDNPYSEAAFKTLKYRPDFPDCFSCIQDARTFLANYFDWYNFKHKHSGIAMLTPYDFHSGQADKVIQKRQSTITDAYFKHPERFVKGTPIIKKPQTKVWINKPDNSIINISQTHNIAV